MELLTEKNDIWETLKSEKLPIVLYGMGNGADKILKICENLGITVSEVFASDEFVRGHFYKQYKVKKYSEICSDYDDFVILVAFATSIPEVIQRIERYSKEHKLYIPDVPVCGDDFFNLDFYKNNKEYFIKAYELLSDEASKKLFRDALNYKISGKLEYLHNNSFENLENLKLLNLSDNESYVDIGAYTGDTVKEFIQFTNGKYNKIFAFEPDRKNFKKLEQNTSDLPRVKIFPFGTSNKNENVVFSQTGSRASSISKTGNILTTLVSLDEELKGETISYVKIDSEGYEMKTLFGIQNIIKEQKPKLNVAIYHRNEDIFALLLYIHSLNPDYKFYIRRIPYLPLWDMNLYCV